MQYLPYIILLVLFALPLLLFLKKQDAFKAFAYPKFVWALNRAALIYLIFSLGFAFLFAWLESTYTLSSGGTTTVDIVAEVAMGFMMITVGLIAPLILILNIIKWATKKKPTAPTDTNQ
ncbi:hypothetical protein AM493_02925 [Flavobacterium akiainvivens]|uniref:Uncharacterized protein n=1 Tax=Flavobacterium akiainvivens TaxID=1202724 RepID=A0A0M8M952_9FLAO|nr:hypothetical protein [Flavobacterium akiainvivens]KOS05105.1 hypothetical protein AM493_02925 [Flavobacterium akiainvivens]SFQ51602.1 hypothetical protein SAMN05444144_106219 [Flavobacterium akiainvivens]